MHFRIKGLGPSHGVMTLNCNVANQAEAKAFALAQSIDVISIEEVRTNFRWRSHRTVPFDLLRFSQELHALLIAGLSIVEALATLTRKESDPGKRQIIETLALHLREGKPFSDALHQREDLFPPLYVALMSASERTGDLPNALTRFISYRTRMDDVQKRVRAALLYPLLLLGVGGLVILFLMFYVVPRFSRIYTDFGRDLPWMSKLLMNWGSFVTQNSLSLLGYTATALVMLWMLFRSRLTAQSLTAPLRRFSPLREKLHHYALARFYRTSGLLQQGGIPLVEALQMSRTLLGDDAQHRLSTAISELRAGQTLSSVMDRQGLAPPVALDLIKVGEKSGALGEKLIRIADFYDDEQARWIEAFARLFEPLLMLGIGIVIACVIVLLYLPIFDLAGAVQ